MWEYRIIKERDQYTVREVVELEEGKGWTEDEVSPYGLTRDEMRQSFRYFLEAVYKPVIIVEGDAIIGSEEPLTILEDYEYPRKNKQRTTKRTKRKAR